MSRHYSNLIGNRKQAMDWWKSMSFNQRKLHHENSGTTLSFVDFNRSAIEIEKYWKNRFN